MKDAEHAEALTEPLANRVKQIADMIGSEAYSAARARGDWSPAAIVWYTIADDLETAADFIAEAVNAKTDPQTLASFLQTPAPVCRLEAVTPEEEHTAEPAASDLLPNLEQLMQETMQAQGAPYGGHMVTEETQEEQGKEEEQGC